MVERVDVLDLERCMSLGMVWREVASSESFMEEGGQGGVTHPKRSALVKAGLTRWFGLSGRGGFDQTFGGYAGLLQSVRQAERRLQKQRRGVCGIRVKNCLPSVPRVIAVAAAAQC